MKKLVPNWDLNPGASASRADALPTELLESHMNSNPNCAFYRCTEVHTNVARFAINVRWIF